MIKISISLLLDAIEDNINDEELQSIDFETHKIKQNSQIVF